MPDNRSGTVFIVTLVLAILATVFVALRLLSKGLVVRKLASDDYLTVVAWVFATALSVSIMIGTKYGLGAPDAEIPAEWSEPLKRAIYAFTVLYNPALMATKTAILILYRRMAAAHPFLRYASIATGVVVNLAGLVLTLISIFQCRPVRAGFDGIDGECVDVVSLYLSSAPINVLTDLAILLLPLPILTRLRMEFKQKCALVCTFIVGGFVTVVDVVRIIYLQTALSEERDWDSGSTITAATRPPNFTYHASFSLMWSAVEVSVGLMCCCVLVLKPLIMKVMPGFLGRVRRESRASGSGSSGGSKERERDQPAPIALAPHVDRPSIDMPNSPQSNLGAIPEDDASDDGLDFFQMLASDPSAPRPRGRSISTASPATFSRHRMSEEPILETDDDGMDFFQMLASDPPSTPIVPEVALTRPPSHRRSIVRRATLSLSKRNTIPPEPIQEPMQQFFDFVNMRGRTPLTELTKREAWWPIMFVSILFFLWGFAYGLLGTLNAQIQSLLHYDAGATFALHNAYWIGYFLGPPLCGHWVLSREGFKATFMTGLAIYATGAMSFWPSSVLKSYPGFFVSNVIVALGLSVLEVAANPFIALAGPGDLSEARLCFAQAIQGLGSIVSPILAAKALFSGIDEEDLFRLQYCYLAVALFVVALAVVFFYAPLSEATDDELEAMATQRLYNAELDKGEKAYRGAIDARKLLLVSGVIMMLTYVGAQESISYFWSAVITDTQTNVDPFWMQAVGHGLFAGGRFVASGLAYIKVPPRYILLACIVGSIITSALGAALPPGNAPLGFLVAMLFFEAPLFPLIFAMTLRGQGKHTKLASTFITMAVSGGAIWPSVTYGVDLLHPNNARYAVRVTTGLYAVSLVWPVGLSVSRVMRRWVDPKWSRTRMVPEPTEWASPSMGGKNTVAHVETTWTPSPSEEKQLNPLGISIPGDNHYLPRKKSVAWE